MVNISKIEGIDVFIKNTPNIKKYWRDYTSNDLYDPNERLPYLEMGRIAAFLYEHIDDRELITESFEKLDDIFLKPRDDDLRNLMFSFIEDLTNGLMRQGRDPEELVRFLPERFKEVYDDVINFWEEYDKFKLSQLENQ